jgi:hypothetical protein
VVVNAAQRPRKSARKRKQTQILTQSQSQLQPASPPQQEQEQGRQQLYKNQNQQQEQKRKRVKLEFRANRSPSSQRETQKAVACTPSKLAAITKIVEKQQQLIDQLMSERERGASVVELPDREMELHEQAQLSKKLCALEPEHLGTACSFAQLTEVASGDEKHYTLDLSRQNRRVLWRLWDYAHKNARTPAQQRAAAKHKLLEREMALAIDRPTATADSSDSSDSDSSDDNLSDSDSE